MGRCHPSQRLGIVDKAVTAQLQGQAHRGLCGTLRRPRLQQPQRPVLNGELDLLHVGGESLQRPGGADQFVVDGGLLVAQRGDRFDVDRAGYHVVPLTAPQPLAELRVGAGHRVSRKNNAGTGIGVDVAEDHGLHHRRGAAPVVEPVMGAIGGGARRAPRREHSLDRGAQL